MYKSLHLCDIKSLYIEEFYSMPNFKIHPIVTGIKFFDKTMMTYQHGYDETYTIPIYCWYIEGGEKK